MKLEIESEKVLEAAKKCPEWKEELKTLFPEAFEEDDTIDLSASRPTICQNISCAVRGYYLASEYTWKIEKNSENFLHLIPTKKEK